MDSLIGIRSFLVVFLRLALISVCTLGPVAAECQEVGDSSEQGEPEKRFCPADQNAPAPLTIRKLPQRFSHSLRNVFTSESLRPLLAGSALTVGAAFFDHEISHSSDRQEQKRGLSAFGETAGRQRVLLPAYGSLLLISSLSRSERLRLFSMDLAAGWAVNNLLTTGLKYGVNRHRPNGKNQLSFPSGHTSNAFTWATILSHHAKTPLVTVSSFTLASLIGAARVRSRDHHIADVLAGATLGYLAGKSVVRSSEKDRSNRRLDWEPSVSPEGVGVTVHLNIE